MKKNRKAPDMNKVKEAGSIELNIVSRREYWRGFQEEATYIKTPTVSEKQRMLQYPLIRSSVRMIAQPLLSAEPKIIAKSDSQQKKLLRHWFIHYYRKIATNLLNKGIGWGFCAGEKVYKPVIIDGKTYLMLVSVITPPPNNIRFVYGDPLEISGFEYNAQIIEKDKTALYIYQGDEICRPYGVSLCDDVYWAWIQLMEDWSRWSIWKDFKAIPPFILEYPEERVAGADGTTVDINEARAEAKLKSLRNLSGITIPKKKDSETQTWETLWSLKEIEISDKTVAFLDSINKLESLIFIGAMIPRDIIEQAVKVGSYARLKEQADYFFMILQSRLEDWEEYLRRWIIDPMLQANFGKVEATIDLDLGDDLRDWYLDMIKIGVETGYTSIDFDEILDRVGVPHIVGEPEPKIETTANHSDVIVLEKLKKEKLTGKELREEKIKIAGQWRKIINRKLLPLQKKTYDAIEKELTKLQGRMGLGIVSLIKKEWTPNDLASKCQIPRNIFSILKPLIEAYHIGANAVYAKTKESPAEKISKSAMKEIRLLALKFLGISGRAGIGGQPELLEDRIFYACMSVAREEEMLNAFSQAFTNYVEVTLSDNVANELKIATNIGVKYAVKDLLIRQLEKQKKGE
ncbi:hypothetical protein ES707_20136 [subsurface metagenome]